MYEKHRTAGAIKRQIIPKAQQSDVTKQPHYGWCNNKRNILNI